ncbi:MAG: hypothetical protein JST68_26030 [Bacteroidetes bacterium]|nr:hypothetical protein [Bacteroidota bacterium]
MNIVQSFWSRALMDALYGRHGYGWMNRKYCFVSQALSCLCLREFYPSVRLITDTMGKRILVDELRLPYTDVQVSLDVLESFPGCLWALKNLYTYSIQQEPFLHIDGDIYLDAPVSEAIHSAPVAANALLECHSPAITSLFRNFASILPGASASVQNARTTLFSPGFFGGTDIKFITRLAKEALSVIMANRNFITYRLNMITDDFNGRDAHLVELISILIDSYFFTQRAGNMNKKVVYAGDRLEFATAGNSLTISTPAAGWKYQPLFNRKREGIVCEAIEYRLRRLYPSFYYRLLSILNNKTFNY